MSRFHVKSTYHTRNQEYLKLNTRKKKSINANTKMTKMLEVSNKDFKAATTKIL